MQPKKTDKKVIQKNTEPQSHHPKPKKGIFPPQPQE